MDLRPDQLVEQLRGLVPDMAVAGGCFAHWLPDPTSVPIGKRYIVWKLAQDKAVRLCLKGLLGTVRLPAIEPAHLPSGSRRWPAGYVGSVSHKGARVVAILGRKEAFDMVGVDIDDRRKIDLSVGLHSERPLGTSAPLASAILFSVKEAAFKALHPLVNQRLGFNDVFVHWSSSNPPLLFGTAYCRDHQLTVHCSLVVPSWIVSTAICPVEARPLVL